MNRLYSSDISLYFEKGDITSATYRSNPEGVLYPMTKIKKEEERVQDFKWDESKRPISWETMIMDEDEFLAWKKENTKQSEKQNESEEKVKSEK